MGRRFLVRLAAPLLLLAAGCGSASADVVATYKTPIGSFVLEASESGWGRMEEQRPGAPRLDYYTVITPQGRNLRVMLHKGRWIVADWQDFHAWILGGSRPPATPAPKTHFVADGDQKVGQWTGTAYRSTGESCRNWNRFVVMRGPGLEVLGKVFRANLVYGAEQRRAPPCELQAIDLIGQGVILWINDPETKLEKLESRKIDPGRFRLPSPPLSRSGLFALLSAGLPEKGAPTPVPTARRP